MIKKQVIAFAGLGALAFLFSKKASASNPDTQTFSYSVTPADLPTYEDGTVDTLETVRPNAIEDYTPGYFSSGFLALDDFDQSSIIPFVAPVGDDELMEDEDGYWDEYGEYHFYEYDEDGYIGADGEYHFWGDDEDVEDVAVLGNESMTVDELVEHIAEHLKAKEGLRTYVYDDFNGKPWSQSKIGKATIGYGHLLLPGEPLTWTMTEPQAYELLLSDVRKHLAPVVPYVKVPLTLSQWIVIASMAFQFGPGAIKGATFLNMLNSGAPLDAVEANFKSWSKITVIENGVKKKVVSRGILNRRNHEWAMFVLPEPVVYLA